MNSLWPTDVYFCLIWKTRLQDVIPVLWVSEIWIWHSPLNLCMNHRAIFFYLYTDDRPYDAFSTSQRIIVSYWYLCLYSEIQHFYQNSQRQYVIWVFNSISSFNTVHHFPSSFLALSWQQRETQQMVTCVKFTSDATLLEYLITYGLHAVLSFTLFIWSVCLCCFCFFTFHQVVPLIFKENVT